MYVCMKIERQLLKSYQWECNINLNCINATTVLFYVIPIIPKFMLNFHWYNFKRWIFIFSHTNLLNINLLSVYLSGKITNQCCYHFHFLYSLQLFLRIILKDMCNTKFVLFTGVDKNQQQIKLNFLYLTRIIE